MEILTIIIITSLIGFVVTTVTGKELSKSIKSAYRKPLIAFILQVIITLIGKHLYSVELMFWSMLCLLATQLLYSTYLFVVHKEYRIATFGVTTLYLITFFFFSILIGYVALT